MAQEYLNENILLGNLGHLSVILTFTCSLLASIGFLLAQFKSNERSEWEKIAKTLSYTFCLSTLAIAVFLFVIIYGNHFEYHYAWAHSSLLLPTHYIISSFWEGQEGSFLLWMFWQAVMLIALMKFSKKKHYLSLSIICFSHTILTSMLLGVNLGVFEVGSSPFILLRNAIEGPIFSNPDYLNYIQDGNGLNPLLQNYWMLIHPPILFFGFSCCIVPFALASESLFIHKSIVPYISKIKKWVLLAFFSLGMGILLGSFWAYETLNFGGYWAWDPVENASLVPFLILIIAFHLLILLNKTKRYEKLTIIFILSIYLLVLYASYLTRSGILGDNSVHSFTNLGLDIQLIIYIISFVCIAYLAYRKILLVKTAGKQAEENLFTREFIMFSGSILLLTSCLQILISTSVPVFNALFGLNLAPPVEVVSFYNQWQLPIYVIITATIGIAMLSKYKKNIKKPFLKKVASYLMLSVLLSILLWLFVDIGSGILWGVLILCLFTFCVNAHIIIKKIKQKKISGASISHSGFALMLIGIAFSGFNQKILSVNLKGIDYGEQFESQNNNPAENKVLFFNEPELMGHYALTYFNDYSIKEDLFYNIRFTSKKRDESFILTPKAQNNPQMGLIASPDIYSSGLDMMYVHLSMIPLDEKSKKEDIKYNPTVSLSLIQGQESPFLNFKIKLIAIKQLDKMKNLRVSNEDKIYQIVLNIEGVDGIVHNFNINVLKYKGQLMHLVHTNKMFQWKVQINAMDLEKQKILLDISTPRIDQKKYVVIKAILFPLINLYWLGALLMLAGGFISLVKSKQKNKQ